MNKPDAKRPTAPTEAQQTTDEIIQQFGYGSSEPLGDGSIRIFFRDDATEEQRAAFQSTVTSLLPAISSGPERGSDSSDAPF